jgi:uncharacterized protein YuzE
MKLQYYPETDSLYIELSDKPSVDSVEVATGVVADFDTDGNLIGLDIDKASVLTDLKHLNMKSFPVSDVSMSA